MKKIFKYFVLLITLFSSFIFSSCSNNYAEVEVPVSNYQIINDGGSFGTTVIQFYVSEEFEYDLDLLKDIDIIAEDINHAEIVLKDYIRYNDIKRDIVDKYIEVYPIKIYKNIYKMRLGEVLM